MNLQYRIDLLVRLGKYILDDGEEWQLAKNKATRENGWFIPEFIDLACTNIAKQFLEREILTKWVESYELPEVNTSPKKIGIVMAGNIPAVGFHDMLCVFVSGNIGIIKTSAKDHILIRHFVDQLISWEPEVEHYLQFAPMLKNCDAYIATGSNNSAGYFEYYFGKYPNLIRRNRTSVAILTGKETDEDLGKLADDVFQYYGLGCRNVTKLYVPRDYDFIPLLGAFRKYDHFADHHKYRNNYDYNLALLILNRKYYMSNEAILLVEADSHFSPISQLNYEYFSDYDKLTVELENHKDLQCIVGHGYTPFGHSQRPGITDYADGVDTLQFVSRL